MMKRLAARRIQAGPEEGWLSLLLVTVMAATAAWSIDDVGWVLGRADWTNFLVWAAILGVAVGFIGSKVGWGRWTAHIVGAAFAALVVPVMVGGVLVPQGGIAERFAATASDGAIAWGDLIIRAQPATRATGHHLLVLGLLLWATGQFAASAVFRHRRPLSAVVVVGALLIGNMTATTREHLGYLMIFSVAALFLLTRLHALDEQATWLRRRIGDPATVGSLYLRGGTVFILIAVVGAFALTYTARSAPLKDAWEGVKPALLDISSAIQRFLPAGPDSRGIGAIQFGPNATIQNIWSTNELLAMTIQREPGDETKYYWRASAYDRFNLFGWQFSETDSRIARAAGDEILADTFDAVPKERGTDVTFTVTPASHRGPYVVSPLAPVAVDRETELYGLGAEQNFFQAVQIDGSEPYKVTARVPLLGDVPGGRTENLLRVAGTEYPEEIRARYLPVTPGAIGPEAEELLADILAKAPANNPYDIASTMVNEFHSRRFEYQANVLDVDCGSRSVTECFAWSKRGYCQHYASLMTVLLRQAQIPARFVQGFLPGEINVRTGVETVKNTSAHAWVEVWFPGHGWVIFDPTGGNVSQAEPIPSGQPVASPTPAPSRSLSSGVPIDEDGPDQRPDLDPDDGFGGPPRPGPSAGGFIIIALLLAASVILVAFLAWRRGPRGSVTPDGVYDGVTRLASRFGFGPRPTQTAYEYAAALGDVMPTIRPDLHTVAAAKVEVAYGRRTLGDDRLAALRESYRKLRVALLRLFFRRLQRRR